MPAALSHVTISASDLDASLAFYTAALAAIGLERVLEFGDEEEDDAPVEAVAWGSGDERGAVAGARSRDRPACTSPSPRPTGRRWTRSTPPRSPRAGRATTRRGDGRSTGAAATAPRCCDPDGNLLEVTAPE